MLEIFFLGRTCLLVRPRIYWKMAFVSGLKAFASSEICRDDIRLCLVGIPCLDLAWVLVEKHLLSLKGLDGVGLQSYADSLRSYACWDAI